MDENLVSSKMQQAITNAANDIATIRTGRSTPSLVENIEVVVYGGQQRLRLREVASITTPDPNMIIIDPWDKSIIGEIRQSIQAANVGFNPNIDGEIIRITIPPMTTEDREKYVKLLSAKLENAKIVIRQIRADAMQIIKRAFEDKSITEDQKFGQEKRLQELTDQNTRKIEEMGEVKKKELLQI